MGDYPIYIYTYVCIGVYGCIDFTALKFLILHMSGLERGLTGLEGLGILWFRGARVNRFARVSSVLP